MPQIPIKSLLPLLLFLNFQQSLAQFTFQYRYESSNNSWLNEFGKEIPGDSARILIESGSYKVNSWHFEDERLDYKLIPQGPKWSKFDKKYNEESVKKLSNQYNKVLPPFELDGLSRSISNKDLQDKIVVFNFWYTSCSPCVREMPDLNDVVEKMKDKPIVFLAPTFEKPEKVYSFLNKRPFKYHILFESKLLNEEIGISNYPTHIVVDKKGQIREISVGATSNVHVELLQILNWLLEEGKG